MPEQVIGAQIIIPVTTQGAKGAKEIRKLAAGLKSTNTSLTKTNKNLAKTSKLMKGLKSALPIVGFATLAVGFKKIISLTAEQQKVESQLNAVLASTKNAAGLTAKEIKNMATSLQSVTTFGDEAIIKAQSLLLTFTKIGKDVFPAATETVLNMAEAMGTDLKTQAIQVGKALNDPIMGVTALRRVGVQLTEQQEDLIKSFVDTGQIAKAQGVILEELETQFGGVARASAKTLGGALSQLDNTIGDVAEDIGKEFAPALEDLAQAFSFSLKDGGAFKSVLTGIGVVIGKIVQTIAVLVRALGILDALSRDAAETQKVFKEELKAAGVSYATVAKIYVQSGGDVTRASKIITKGIREGNQEYKRAGVALLNINKRLKELPDQTDEAIAALSKSSKQLVGIYEEEGVAANNTALARINGVKAAEKASKDAVEKAAKTQAQAIKLLSQAGDPAAFLAQQRQVFAKQVARVRNAGLDIAALEKFQQQQRLNQFRQFFAQTVQNQDATIAERQASLQAQLDTVLTAENTSYQERLAAQTAFNEQSNLLEQQRFQAIAQTTAQVAQVGSDFLSIAQSFSQIRQNQIQSEIDALEARGASEEEIEAKRKSLARKAAQDQKRFSIFSILLDTAVAVTKALASAPPPASFALAALSTAKGATQLTAVASTPIPAAQFGGQFTVAPGNEADSALVRVNEGERLDVTPTRGTNGSSGNDNKDVNLIVDGRSFKAYMTEEVQTILNSGNVTINRSGVVRVSA